MTDTTPSDGVWHTWAALWQQRVARRELAAGIAWLKTKRPDESDEVAVGLALVAEVERLRAENEELTESIADRLTEAYDRGFDQATGLYK